MEITIFEEPQSLPFQGYRYYLSILVNGKEFVGFTSTYVFDNRDDAWTAAIEDHDDFVRD